MLSGISSFMDSKHLQRIDREIAANGGQKKLIKINAISPETLTKNYSIKQIDYLSIDTEGCEIEILKKFDFSEINVRVINVENGSRTPELFNYLNTVGYKLYKCIGCDEIYQKRQPFCSYLADTYKNMDSLCAGDRYELLCLIMVNGKLIDTCHRFESIQKTEQKRFELVL